MTSSGRLLICSFARLSTGYAKVQQQSVPHSWTNALIQPGDSWILWHTAGLHAGFISKVPWSFLQQMDLMPRCHGVSSSTNLGIHASENLQFLLFEMKSVCCAFPVLLEQLGASTSASPSISKCCKQRLL